VDLTVRIVRFVLDHQPPMFLAGTLDAHSVYPQTGAVRCSVLRRWRDAGGREFVRISTADPDCIESSEGLSEFVVLQTQVSAPPDHVA
jgi:hypothetical protein